jgi:hypothetical protein
MKVRSLIRNACPAQPFFQCNDVESKEVKPGEFVTVIFQIKINFKMKIDAIVRSSHKGTKALRKC